VHLVGFVIRIYLDARSSECQIYGNHYGIVVVKWQWQTKTLTTQAAV